MNPTFTNGTYYKFGLKAFYYSLVCDGIIFFIGVIAVILVSFSLGVGSPAGLDVLLPGLILMFLYAIGALSMAKYNYACHQFMLDDYALHIRTGIVNRSEMSIPYRQIQDVNIEESYIERMFGVASLSVLTAGHEDTAYAKAGEAGVPEEESSGFFQQVERAYADELQKVLMRSSNIQQVVATNPAPVSGTGSASPTASV
jgi:uncharacterized membrane protein YdbT with pleckstrin-like domain